MDGLRVRVDDALTTATLAVDRDQDGQLVLLVSRALRFSDPDHVVEFAHYCAYVAEHNQALIARRCAPAGRPTLTVLTTSTAIPPQHHQSSAPSPRAAR